MNNSNNNSNNKNEGKFDVVGSILFGMQVHKSNKTIQEVNQELVKLNNPIYQIRQRLNNNTNENK